MAIVYNTNGGRVANFEAADKNTVTGLSVSFKPNEQGVIKKEYDFMESFDPSTVTVKKHYLLGDSKVLETTDYIYYPSGPLTFDNIDKNNEKEIYFKIIDNDRIYVDSIKIKINKLKEIEIPKVTTEEFVYDINTEYAPKIQYDEENIIVLGEEQGTTLRAKNAGKYRIKFALKNPKKTMWETGEPFKIQEFEWEIKKKKAEIRLIDPYNPTREYIKETNYILRDGEKNLPFIFWYDGLQEDEVSAFSKVSFSSASSNPTVYNPIEIGFKGNNILSISCDFSKGKGINYENLIFSYKITINQNEGLDQEKLNYNYKNIEFILNLELHNQWVWGSYEELADRVWLDGLAKNIANSEGKNLNFINRIKRLPLTVDNKGETFLGMDKKANYIDVKCIYQPDISKDSITNGLIFQTVNTFNYKINPKYDQEDLKNPNNRKTEFSKAFQCYGKKLFDLYLPNELKDYFGQIEYRVIPSGFKYDGKDIQQANENIYKDYFVFPSANNMGLNEKNKPASLDSPTDLDTVIQYPLLSDKDKLFNSNIEIYETANNGKESLRKKTASDFNNYVYYLLRSPYNFTLQDSLSDDNFIVNGRIFTIITPEGIPRILKIIPAEAGEVNYEIYNYKEGVMELDTNATNDINIKGLYYAPIFKISDYKSINQ